jgi:hypothetical protein
LKQHTFDSYLKENPEHGAQGVNLSQFSFKIPAPQDRVGKRAKTDQNDGLHRESSKPLLTAFTVCQFCWEIGAYYYLLLLMS